MYQACQALGLALQVSVRCVINNIYVPVTRITTAFCQQIWQSSHSNSADGTRLVAVLFRDSLTPQIKVHDRHQDLIAAEWPLGGRVIVPG
jgi:hypothetical protein